MRFLPFIVFFTTIASGLASPPRIAVPLVTVYDSGRFFFTMLPPLWTDQGKTTREPFGVAYELRDNGALHELWRTKGWYSFNCFLSDDGRYLVAVSDSPASQKPSREALAVVFYDRGKLLRQFFIADLVKDANKAGDSAYLREWFFRRREIAKDVPGPEDPCFTRENNFILTTIDGISYTFDATQGAITATTEVVIPPVE
jgi:hypothetical protein